MAGAEQPPLGPDGRSAASCTTRSKHRDEIVRSLAALVCGESTLGALTAQQLGDVAFLLECAVRGNVTKRSLEAWLAQLAERDDRRVAIAALRAR